MEEYKTQIEQLQVAFETCVKRGFTCFISFYHNKVHVTLTKESHNGAPGLRMDVRTEAPSVPEAFEKAFANFPDKPIDGIAEWHNPRLAAPVTEGEFTETKT